MFSQLVAKRYNNDFAKMRALSIVEEDGGKRINMAHLVSQLKTKTKHPISCISSLYGTLIE